MSILAIAMLTGILACSSPLRAAEFSCPSGDVACLVAAIQAANANGEENRITLAADSYILTEVNNAATGPTGLPPITSTLTVVGAAAEATVIERSAGAPAFRILAVQAPGFSRSSGSRFAADSPLRDYSVSRRWAAGCSTMEAS